MTSQKAIQYLEQNLRFEPRTAIAYVQADGLCEYCGHELIFDRLGYACAQIDHLLPRAKYPEQITGMQQNFVLSCSLCNGLKRDDPILKTGEDPETMLINERDELIDRAKKVIADKLQEPNRHWNQAITIFKDLGFDPKRKFAR